MGSAFASTPGHSLSGALSPIVISADCLVSNDVLTDFPARPRVLYAPSAPHGPGGDSPERMLLWQICKTGDARRRAAMEARAFLATEAKDEVEGRLRGGAIVRGFLAVGFFWGLALIGTSLMTRGGSRGGSGPEASMATFSSPVAPAEAGAATRGFVAVNTREAASGARLGSPVDFGGRLVVDVSSPATLSHEDGARRRWVVAGLHDSEGESAEIWFAAPGTRVVRARPTLSDGDGDDEEGAWAEVVVEARVVRRELRSLSEAERAAYFGALHVLYATGDDEGSRRYGADYKSADWLVREHLYGAADRACDHWHDDMGILNHHVGITWQFEKALRSVDATTAAHYWDYSADASTLGASGGAWAASEVFRDDWFGGASFAGADHVVDAGAWAFLRVRGGGGGDDDDGFSGITNPYGLLRSPWNTNKVPFLGRFREVLGNDGGGFDLPACADFVPFLNDPKLSLGSVASGLNGGLHGPVHIMVGGHWGDDDARWGAYLAEDAPFSPSQVLLYSKFAWRAGFVRCPDVCAADAPQDLCRCACPDAAHLDQDDHAGALELLDAMRLRARSLPFSDAFASSSSSSDDGQPSLVDDAAYFGSHNITAKDILDLVCAVGFPGELFTSAAPQDPLFWPLHGLAERFLQYARVLDANGALDLDEAWSYKHRKNVASDTGLVCDWSADRPDGDRPPCEAATCPGHREDDLLPFADLFPDQAGLLTNRQFYDLSSPIDGRLDYIYDNLDVWPGCAGGTPLLKDAPT